MPIVLAVVGVVAIIALAMRGTSDAGTIDTTVPGADTAGVTDNPVGSAVMSNDESEATSGDSSFMPGVTVNGGGGIVPTDPDTWPGGDAIWDVARAIAHQEGYGVSMQNAPTRNNNPGDISDGFDTYGGEQLDSKITRFPDAQTGWNELYKKLLRVQQGRSKVFSNNMTWSQFGQKYASDPNWANGMCRALGVSPSARVGDYWNA